MSKSIYGGWESVGEIADGAIWAVAGIHHIHATSGEGYACLCGAKPITARGSTEHIINETLDALAKAGCSIAQPTVPELGA